MNKPKRLVWKQNRIISVKLRNGIYALGQMIEKSKLIFFNHFSENNQWDNIILSNKNVLFSCTPLKTFLKHTEIEVIKNIEPLLNYQLPKLALWSSDLGFNKKMVTIGDYQKEVFVYGNGNYSVVNIDFSSSEKRHSSGLFTEIIRDNVDVSYYEDIKHLDFVTTLDGYPNLNERLYLCWLLGKNVNPKLDVDLGIPLKEYHRTYVDIISGDVKLSDLGY